VFVCTVVMLAFHFTAQTFVYVYGSEPHYFFGVSEVLKKETAKVKDILTDWKTSRPLVDLKAIDKAAQCPSSHPEKL